MILPFCYYFLLQTAVKNFEKQISHFFIAIVILCVVAVVFAVVSPKKAPVISGVTFDSPETYLVKVKKGAITKDFSRHIISTVKAATPDQEEYEWVKIEVQNQEQLQKLSENGDVILTQPDFKRRLFTPNDHYYNTTGSIISGQYDQWNLRRIGFTPADTDAQSAWNTSTGSASTIVAVIDSGINLTHPDIVNYNSGATPVWGDNNLWVNQAEIPVGIKASIDANSDSTITPKEIIDYFVTNNYDVDSNSTIDYRDILATGSVLRDGVDNGSNGYVDDILGFNFADNTNNPSEVNGAVSAGHGTHVSGIIGAVVTNNNSRVNPGLAGVCWSCQIMPLKVINNSGYGFDSDIAEAIDYAVANGAKVINMSLGGAGYSQILQDAITNAWNSGTIVVSASGNDGSSASDSYPSGSTNSLSVGATNYLDQVPYYSNSGGKLDVVAPGDYVLSSFIQFSGCLGSSLYVCSSGTSMASPHVAGLAALLYDLHKDDTSPWGPKEIRSAILKNATDLGSAGFDSTTGFGIINAKAALSATYSSDAVAPTATLNSLESSVVNGTVPINGTASDADLYIYTISMVRTSDNYVVKQYSGRSNVTDSLLFNVNTTAIADGTYNINLRVEDFSGNISNAAPVSVTIDNTAPTSFSLTAPANTAVSTNTKPNLVWTSAVDTHGVHYDVVVDSSTVANDLTATTHTLTTALSEGAHNFYVNAKDDLGNSRSSNTNSYTVDLSPPNDFTVNVTTSGLAPTFTFLTTDTYSGVSYYQISIDGGSFVTVSSPYSPGNLSDGSHSATVRAYDGVGNYKDASVNFSVSDRNSYLKSKGDFNFDGEVDLSDLSILASKWLQPNTTADANGDAKTDLSDLSILASGWLKSF